MVYSAFPSDHWQGVSHFETMGTRNKKAYHFVRDMSWSDDLVGGLGGGVGGRENEDLPGLLRRSSMTISGKTHSSSYVSTSRTHCSTRSRQLLKISEAISTLSERQSSLLLGNKGSAVMAKCGDRFKISCEKRRVDVGFVKSKMPHCSESGRVICMTC
jgi:hypothetical protein